MKTHTFLKTLKENLDKDLIFEYKSGLFVGANYHITEIKNVSIDSVDCGGKSDSWQETIVQLWESPTEINKRNYMKTVKAVEIFDRVDSIRPLFLEKEIKIEYGNATFHTSNLVVHEIDINADTITVKLHSDTTQCKSNQPFR
jgi:calcineurin-like phosphoesterase